jgi:hypothetical protein
VPNCEKLREIAEITPEIALNFTSWVEGDVFGMGGVPADRYLNRSPL